MTRWGLRAADGLAVALAAWTSAMPLTPRPAAAQSWRVEAAVGSAWNLRLPATIEQRGEPRLDFDARFSTRGAELPIYWVVRAERVVGAVGWGIELMHDKLYLENRPPEIERFEITHGFNLVSVVRSSGSEGFRYRFGAGVIAAHPENTVRGRALAGRRGFLAGYHLTGPLLQAALVGARPVLGRTSVLLEAKAIAAHVRVPVADGGARFWSGTLHVNVGLSRRFGPPPGRDRTASQDGSG